MDGTRVGASVPSAPTQRRRELSRGGADIEGEGAREEEQEGMVEVLVVEVLVVEVLVYGQESSVVRRLSQGAWHSSPPLAHTSRYCSLFTWGSRTWRWGLTHRDTSRVNPLVGL